MDFAIQVGFYAIGIPLEILAISAIVRGGLRRYPLVFAYVLVVFLTTVMEIPTALAYRSSTEIPPDLADQMRFNYWRNEGILQVTIFATVISLIYSASSKLAARRLVRLVLVVGAMLYVGISFLLNYDPQARIGMWMTPWTRHLKFCAAILDLALWALLIRAAEKNRILLAVSGGLGITFAGGAIGQAIRSIAIGNLSHDVSKIGGFVIMTADLMLLYILWQVFRKESPAPLAKPRT